LDLRLRLRSAERFSEAAIRFGSRNLNTPPLRSRASLSFVTRADQRRLELCRVDLRRADLGAAGLRRADFRVEVPAMAVPAG
jgi:hypothetical protein